MGIKDLNTTVMANLRENIMKMGMLNMNISEMGKCIVRITKMVNLNIKQLF